MKLPPSARALVTSAYLRHLAASDKPIVLGPYRSELGFEVLYWLPFLHWALKTFNIAPERCIALSRGGMGALYPAAQHADLYKLCSVDSVRLENQVDLETRKMLKQTQITAWDRQIVQDAVEDVLGPRTAYHLLHPSWMYWLFEGWWENTATLPHVARHAEFAPLPVPALPEGLTLPDKFCAVRFYERPTFPLTDEVKTLVLEIVAGLAAKAPVVLLNQSLFADDHTDLPIQGPNVITLPQVPPEQNFLVQAAVLARCKAFVGTYGGVAQWALRYRKPSLSFYTNFAGTAVAHRTLSEVIAAQSGIPFEVCDLKAYALWKAALGAVPEAVAA